MSSTYFIVCSQVKCVDGIAMCKFLLFQIIRIFTVVLNKSSHVLYVAAQDEPIIQIRFQGLACYASCDTYRTILFKSALKVERLLWNVSVLHHCNQSVIGEQTIFSINHVALGNCICCYF